MLLVLTETVAGRELCEAVAERTGRGSEVGVIAPALTSTALEHAMGDVDEASEAARERLERSLAELSRVGIEPVRAEVGDSDLRLAIQDALQTFAADEIVIVAHRDGGPYLERQGRSRGARTTSPLQAP